ncbi:MARVEL domain-containing protein 3-like [Rhea pennata]|uniref:MARVEL domain-containing protein 3-like n=1 Tax=Rhea pennata TaxID=8795 RepID=UPI002E26EED7
MELMNVLFIVRQVSLPLSYTDRIYHQRQHLRPGPARTWAGRAVEGPGRAGPGRARRVRPRCPGAAEPRGCARGRGGGGGGSARKLFQQEGIRVREEMSHAGGQYKDKRCLNRENHGSDRYKEDSRSRKPYPCSKRATEDSRGGQYARASTVSSDPYHKTSGAAPEYFDPPPQCYPSKETFSMKCSKVCTTRGILKFVEITVNLLVLICVGAAHAAVAGFTSLGGLGSFNLNSAYSPFEGTELREVRELDMQFTQMRAPCVYGGVAFSLTAASLTLLFLVAGAKPIQRLTVGLLAGECAFSLLAALGYVAAVGLYLHFVTQVNATEVCKRRERLYARRGYTSMSCAVQGGDAAVGLFGVAAACLYAASSAVCVLAVRSVRAFRSRAAGAGGGPGRDGSARERRPARHSPEPPRRPPALATLV